jgi:hypothetical protein
MPSSTKSIIFSRPAIFDALQNFSEVPNSLISIPDNQDLHNFVNNNESEIHSSYIGLDIDSLFNVNEEDDLCSFLSLFPKRNLVLVEKADSGGVASVMRKYNKLRKFVDRHLQEDQIGLNRWSIVLVVDSQEGMSDDDKNELSCFKDSIQDGLESNKICVYVMEGRLRAANDNRGPHSKHVWDAALPPLLVHLEEKREHERESDSGIYAWRSIVINPTIDHSPIKSVLHEWIRGTILNNQDKEFDPIHFKSENVTSPSSLNLKEVKPLPGFGEFTDDRPLEKNRYEDNVTQQLTAVNLKKVNTESAQNMRDRVEKATKKVDGDVEAGASSLWQQASTAPSRLVTMKDNLTTESSRFREEMSKVSVAEPWQTLLVAINTCNQERSKTQRIAKIVDKAEAHYIGWADRLTIAFVSILIVFYLVFISLYPVLEYAGIGLASFLFACLLGLSGVAAAFFLSYYCEKIMAGGRGVKKLAEQLDTASKANPTVAAMSHLATTYNKNQKLAWAELLDGAIFLSERVQKTVERVTSQVTSMEIDNSENVNSSQEVQADLKIFQEGSHLWHKNKIESDTIKSYASSLSKELSNDYVIRLSKEWNTFATGCDENAHGSYPVHDVKRSWGRSLASLLADFERKVYEKVIEPIRADNDAVKSLKEKFRDLRNISLAAKPMLSSCSVKKSGGQRQFIWVNQNEKLLDEIKQIIRQNQVTQFADSSSTTLPFCGLFVEEVPMDLSSTQSEVRE